MQHERRAANAFQVDARIGAHERIARSARVGVQPRAGEEAFGRTGVERARIGDAGEAERDALEQRRRRATARLQRRHVACRA